MTYALVALGSNIPPRAATIRAGLEDLSALPQTRLLATSSLIETAAVDAPGGSPPFLNGACLLDTALGPRRLLDELLAIERVRGRVRTERNTPRTLDLDLILYGDLVLDEPGLTVPHPRASSRLFVLEPAAEIAPDLRHPLLQRTLAELRDAL